MEQTTEIEPKQHTIQECNKRLDAVGDALYVIGGKWKLRLIIALSEGNTRFNELQRATEGISAKVLSKELKELEMNEFIRRNVNPGPPVTVEYELTGYSDSLQDIITSLHNWGVQHKKKITGKQI